MKKIKTFYKASLLSITCVLLLVAYTALATNAESVSPTITETRITTSGSASDPDIYGDKIVFLDNRNGNCDIYMYDLSTFSETQITTNASDQWDPAIYGDRIVWMDKRNGNADIYMYDLSTSKETQITTNASDQMDPAIYGDRIVWEDFRNGNYYDIYMYDLSTSEEKKIAINGLDPAIYGDRIVWFDGRNGNADIYMYDLSTSRETQITTDTSYQQFPSIYGNRIVWEDWRNENPDVYMYDLSTSKEERITTNDASIYDPTIYGDKIVWTDDRDEEYDNDIYMYDLSTNTETKITTSKLAFYPAICDDKIVWHDWRNGGHDIYMATVSEEGLEPILPVADFSANVTSGYAPLSVQFTDLSRDATGWNWDFESDGIADSSLQNPVYLYTLPGTYTVNLAVSNANGTDSKLATINVLEKPELPVADFLASPSTGKAPLTVTFTDSSTGSPTSWSWKFGDKSISTDQSPVHTYNKAGKYTVSLTVENTAGNNTKKISKYIIVKK